MPNAHGAGCLVADCCPAGHAWKPHAAGGGGEAGALAWGSGGRAWAGDGVGRGEGEGVRGGGRGGGAG